MTTQRKKHCYSKWTDIVHLWANYEYDGLEEKFYSSNMSFYSNGDLYSYGTRIARASKVGGCKYFIINAEHYSKTTSMQQREIYDAIPYHERDKILFTQNKRWDIKYIAQEILQAEIDQIDIKTRNVFSSVGYNDIQLMVLTASRIIEIIKDNFEPLCIDYFDGSKENIQERIIERLTDFIENSTVFLNTRNKKKLCAEIVAKRELKWQEKNKQDIEKFRNYELNRISGGEFKYLRLSKDCKRIETSAGLEIILKDCLRFFRMLEKIGFEELKTLKIQKKANQELKFRLSDIQFNGGIYKFDGFDKQHGNCLIFGCHKIKLDEIINVYKDYRQNCLTSDEKATIEDAYSI